MSRAMTAALVRTVVVTVLLLAASIAASAQNQTVRERDHAIPQGDTAAPAHDHAVPERDRVEPASDHAVPEQDHGAPERVGAQNQPVSGNGQPARPHDHGVPESASTAAQELPAFIPRPTDADREAAFPDVDTHAMHGTSLNFFVLFDQLEWHAGDTATGFDLDSRGWIGGDRDRLWFRAEGDDDGGRLGEAQAHVLFGRQFARWWDLVAGVRQEFRPGPAQTWAAVGIQGLAPYWFEVEATAYVGGSGRTQARLAFEYELLLTNRVFLQPLLEMEFTGKSDPERRIGAGLSATDLGIRLRYEWRREIAPYVGLTWSRKWGGTADFAREDGDAPASARLATGLRLWF
jgi:copper resistance protein B